MGAIVVPPLNVVRTVGNETDITEEYVNATTRDITVTTGTSANYSNLVIGNSRSWTVNSGGWLLVLESLTISGTGELTVNGDSRVV